MKALQIIFIVIYIPFFTYSQSSTKINTVKGDVVKGNKVTNNYNPTIVNNYYRREAKKQQLLDKINSTFGDIHDLHGATIPKLRMGGVKQDFALVNGVFPIHPFDSCLKILVKNGKLYVNTIIRNKQGEVIAAVYENEWTIYDKNYEYNNDATALELVIKGERNAIFRIELIDGAVDITGMMYTKTKQGMGFFKGDTGEGIDMILDPNLKDFTAPLVPTIFKYPRERYLGVRLSNNKKNSTHPIILHPTQKQIDGIKNICTSKSVKIELLYFKDNTASKKFIDELSSLLKKEGYTYIVIEAVNYGYERQPAIYFLKPENGSQRFFVNAETSNIPIIMK